MNAATIPLHRRPGVHQRRSLRTIAATLGDYRDDYTAWAKQVKQLGGVATNWPFVNLANGKDDPNYGKPAAKYSAAALDALAEFSIYPNVQMTRDNSYGYELAPSNIANGSGALTKATGQDMKNLPGLFPDFNKILKYGALVVGAGAVLYLGAPLLSSVLSRRR